MTMRIAIVDDEPLARVRLRGQVEDAALGEVVAEASNGADAIRLVETHQPDVVLLDIRMPGMDGLETARHMMRLPTPPAIVFTTAYDEHALAAFEANAIDYLLKPIRATRLRRALEKAQMLNAAQTRATEEVNRQRASTHLSGLIHGDLALIEIDRVRYCQADKGYVDIIWDNGSMLIEQSLRSLEETLGDRFVRVHRNALVAVAYITGLVRDDRGNYYVEISGCEERLAVSRRLVPQVRKRLVS